jgi:hypothetical protein
MAILSTNGRPKHVVGLKETRDAIVVLVQDTHMRQYNLQVALMLLIVLYSGVRLSSLIPTYKCLQNDWKYLKWKVRNMTDAIPNQKLLTSIIS